MNVREKAIQGYKWNLIATVLGVVAQLLQVYFTARFLSPAEYGIWGVVVLVLGFVTIFSDFGISSAIIHHQSITLRQVSSLYWVNIFCGAVLALIILAATPLLESFFNISGLFLYFLLLAISVFIITAGKQFEILLQKEMQFRLLSTIEMVSTFSNILLSIGLLLAGFKTIALVYGFLLGCVIKTACLLYFGCKEHRPALVFNFKEIKQHLQFGGFQLGEKNLNFFAERFDQIIIGRVLGPVSLGLFNFSFNLISQPINRINPIVNKVALPLFAKLQTNQSELKHIYFRTLKTLVYVNASILIGLVAVADSVIPVFFGDKWLEAVPLLQLLAVVVLLRSIWNPLGSLLLAMGKASWGFYWNILLFAITAPLMFFALSYGHVGAVGWALLCIQLILFFPAYRLLLRPLLGPCFKEFFSSIGSPLLISIVMGVSTILFGMLMRQYYPVSLVTLAAQICFGAVAQMSLLWLLDKATFTQGLSFCLPKRKTAAL